MNSLDTLGKRISEDFIVNKTDMTAALSKIASENGLNKQQINRVAEVANVEAYLALMKTADDKYLTFPVADPSSIYKEAQGGTISAYNDAPRTSLSTSAIFGAYNKLDKTANWSSPIVFNDKAVQVALCKESASIIKESSSVSDKLQKLSDKGLIKKAEHMVTFSHKGKRYRMAVNEKSMKLMSEGSVFSPSETFKSLKSRGYIKEAEVPNNVAATIKLGHVQRGVIRFVNNELSTRSSNALCTMDKLYNLCKQACLSGNTPSEIVAVIKSATAVIGEDVTDKIIKKLAISAPHLSYDIVNVDSTPDADSEIYKTAKALEEEILWTARLDSALDKLHKKYSEFTNENSVPNVFKHIDGTRFASDFVKTSVDKIKATPILAAFAAGILFGHKTGKEAGKREQGRVLQHVLGKPKKGLY